MKQTYQIEQVEQLLHKLRCEYYKRKMTMVEAGLDVLQQNDMYLHEALMDLNLNANQKRTNAQKSRELAIRRSQRETYRQKRMEMQYRGSQPQNQTFYQQLSLKQQQSSTRAFSTRQQMRYYDEDAINQISSRIKQIRSKNAMRAQDQK